MVKTKLNSILLGVSGIGILSQFQNFVNIIAFTGSLGFSAGITKYVSQHYEKDPEETSRLFSSCLRILSIVSVLLLLGCLFFSREIAIILVNEPDYFNYIIIISFFIPFIILNNFFEAYIKGLQKIEVFVKVSIISALVSLVISVPLIYFFSLTGAVFASVVNFAAYTIICYIYLKIKKLLPVFSLKFKVKSELILNIFRIGIITLISTGVTQISILIIRKITIDIFGLEGNGIFQSVFSLSVNYFGFIFITLSTYSFPRFSSLESGSDIIAEININFRYILLIMVPLVLIIFQFRYFVINLLFSKDFTSSEMLYKFQFLGDLFKGLSWALCIWLVPKLKLKTSLLLDVSFSINFILIYLFLLNTYNLGLSSISIAYLLANIIHCCFAYFISKRLLNFIFTYENKMIFMVGLILIVTLYVVSSYSINAGFIILVPVLILFFYLGINKSEFSSMSTLLSSYYKKYKNK